VDTADPEPLDHTRLAAARLRAAELQPFLAVALYALTPVASYDKPTFAVDEKWRLYVNPGKLREWTVPQVAGVLLHEVGHVIRDHAGRGGAITGGDPVAAMVWNVAADAEINDDLIAARVTLPENPVTPKSLKLPPNKVAEFYYARLNETGVAPPPGLDCGTGCHGQGAGNDSPLLPAGITEADGLLLRRRVAEEIARLVANQPGMMGGGWQRWAEATLRPVLDWRRLLNAKVKSATAAVTGAVDYSYARPPRRRVPGVVLPSMRRPLPRVAVIIDTSASVRDTALTAAWTEVHGCLRALGVRRDLLTVYAADAKAHRVTGALSRRVALTGGGGTDMASAISTALNAARVPDLVIVITDGLTPWPPARPRREVIVALLPTPLPRPAPPAWARVVEVAVA
jgi:predicted metal-dependent peptidase